MIQGIEKLPVMQLQAGTELPPNVSIVELAKIKHNFPDGRTQRVVTRTELVVGRTSTGDVYYAISDGTKPEIVGCISGGSIKTYKSLMDFKE